MAPAECVVCCGYQAEVPLWRVIKHFQMLPWFNTAVLKRLWGWRQEEASSWKVPLLEKEADWREGGDSCLAPTSLPG